MGRQFPKITSHKVAFAAGLRDREDPSRPVLGDKAIKDISRRLMLVSQLDDLSALCWVAKHLLGQSYRRIAESVPLSFGRVRDRVVQVDRWLDAIVPKESQYE